MLATQTSEHYEHKEEYVPAEEALALVMSQTGEGVYASADVLFKGAVFGRDSLKVGRDLLEVRPHLTREILSTLASFQGIKTDEVNEEEPGKIMHEMRREKGLDATSAVIFNELTSPASKNWGKEWDDKENCWRMVYFGSVDSTPSYVQLLTEYCESQGDDILDEAVVLRDGSEITVRETMRKAVSWIVQQLEESPTGLLGYKRVNPNGIENQVWKDSKEFYVHADGSYVNHNASVASIEVQGIVYEALIGAGRYMADESVELARRAEELRDRTLELLWNPEARYFSVGVDQDENGHLRPIDTKAANVACLLDSRFFDMLPEEDRRLYISSIVETIMSPDFLTDAGIRSRALSDAKLVPFWDYHGSHVTWPKETYDIIRGLHRQGFSRLAEQAQNRMLNAVHKSDAFPEFIYVDAAGLALIRPDPEGIAIDSTNRPEGIQAWTVSSVMAAMADELYGPVEPNSQQEWQKVLEERLLSDIPDMPFCRERSELEKRYPDYGYHLIKRQSKTSSNFLHEKIA